MLLKLRNCILIITVIGVLLTIPACARSAESSRAKDDEPPEMSMVENSSTEQLSGDYAGIYLAEPLHFSEENVAQFLTYCGDQIKDSEMTESKTALMQTGNCISGNTFLCREGTGYHPHTLFQYFDQNKWNKYCVYPIYSGEESYATNKQYTVGWMFEDAKDLSFSAAEESEKYVREALSCLGCTDLTLLRTLYIDHKTMNTAIELLTTDPNYAPVGEEKENNGYPSDKWTAEDEVYVFSFGIAVGNTYLSPRFEVQETTTYIGSQIIVWYSKDGIDFLSVDMPWTVTGISTEPQKIISEKTAQDVVGEKMSSILTFQNIEVETPVLEYQYRQEGDEWHLLPVWSTMVTYQPAGSSTRQYEFVCVDAISGQEI